MDPNRLEETVKTHENALYRAALAILGDAQEAQDAVQDAFLRYLEKAPDFASPEHEKSWLLRVTVNGCKSRLRSPWRRRRSPLLESFPAATAEEQGVMEAVRALPAKDQAAEIAAMTGEAEGTVRSRLSRARAKLRRLLGED